MKGKLQVNNVVSSDVQENNQLKMLTLPEAYQLFPTHSKLPFVAMVTLVFS